MSFLRLLPRISVPPIEPRGFDESFLAEQFVDRLKTRLAEMQRDLAEHEQLDVAAFLPSGQAISVEAVGYANPALVTLHGREQGSGKACTLLAHQSSIQVLVSIEPIPSGAQRKVVSFEAE
ncbi:MAG: hypothetical protein KGS09_07830 [Nitrospirae bacterium]|nr:hypothetical protein [Nitrospirota bacterium]